MEYIKENSGKTTEFDLKIHNNTRSSEEKVEGKFKIDTIKFHENDKLVELHDIVASCRRVSFPKNENDLVTGYMEPYNPWHSVTVVNSVNELIDLYKSSCEKHNTKPIQSIIEHLINLDLRSSSRYSELNLREQKLTPESCEALEEIFKRVQYRVIDISACNLNDIASSALFDMIEYYEAANELDISQNPDLSMRGWQSCTNMIKKSRALETLSTGGIPISEITAASLGKSLNDSCLRILKLEHCGLTGRPLSALCNALKKNKTLRELWLASNDLCEKDAKKLSDLLKTNLCLQFLDISNNNIKDNGVKHIVGSLISQSTDICGYNWGNDTYKNEIFLNNSPGEKVEQSKTINRSSGRSMLDALLNMPTEETNFIQTSSFNINTAGTNNNDNNIFKNTEINSATALHIFKDTHNQDITVNTELTINLSEKDVDKNEFFLLSSNNNIESDNKNRKYDDVFHSSNSEYIDVNENDESDSKHNNHIPNIKLNNETDTINVFENCKLQEINEIEHFKLVEESSRVVVPQFLNSNESKSKTILSDMDSAVNTEERINESLKRLNQAESISGLQAIVLWNNNITRESGEYIADVLEMTHTLELLNIGKNTLSNDFIRRIEKSLKHNKTLINFGLQGIHLSADGIKTLSNILEFGGNSTLQRIDLRDNYIQVDGLVSLHEALKSNKSITRLDIDDIPKRLEGCGEDTQFSYSRALQNIRTLCSRNSSPHDTPIILKRSEYPSSRKISLTCNIRPPLVEAKKLVRNENSLDVKRRSGVRLRSPLPSPPSISPSSSPVPSPSRSRFQVFRVVENKKSSNTIVSTTSVDELISNKSDFPNLRFEVNVVENIKNSNILLEHSEITKLNDQIKADRKSNNIERVLEKECLLSETCLYNRPHTDAEQFDTTDSTTKYLEVSDEFNLPNVILDHNSKDNRGKGKTSLDNFNDPHMNLQKHKNDVMKPSNINNTKTNQSSTSENNQSICFDIKEQCDFNLAEMNLDNSETRVCNTSSFHSNVDNLMHIFHSPTNMFTDSYSCEESNYKVPPSLKTISNTAIAAANISNTIFDVATKQIKGIADFGKQVLKQTLTYKESNVKSIDQSCENVEIEEAMDSGNGTISKIDAEYTSLVSAIHSSSGEIDQLAEKTTTNRDTYENMV